VDEIIVRRDPASIATVTINRPEKRNAVNQAMWRELGRLFEELSDDPAVRAVILTGAGGQFSAGADISEFSEVRSNAEQAERYEADGHRAEEALANLKKPTIAAISGFAVGGGCGLALCCDFRLADATARMGIPAARLGIVYSMSECQKLYNAVGAANAKRVLFSAELFDAAACFRMGLVDGVVEGEVLDGAVAFAERMAENAPLSIEGSKVAINALAAGQADAKAAELEAIMYRAFDSEDYKEGAAAFMEKRRPNFAGR
jgi:enoyl-CoA hydratase/carnithine racemase